MRSPSPAQRPLALVVDDDHVMCMLEEETLTQFEFEVVLAANGEEALERLQQRRPDLVLLDVEMPGVDGFEVCLRIRERWDTTEVPVIMVTGMDDLDSINRAYESGANDFIAKPINWPILGHRARYVLRAAQSARSLRELEEKQSAMVRAMPDMMFLLTREGIYLDYKEGYGTRPFVMPEQFLGRNLADVLPADVAGNILRALERAIDGGDLQTVLYKLPMQEGMHHYEARAARSGENEAVVVVRDITLQKLNEEKIRRLAYFDTLTGMPNRQHFIERLDRELLRAQRDERKLALLFLDLDGFKRVNDTLGHSAGDHLLQAVAERLKEKLRAGDIVSRPALDDSTLHFARLGGDEFTVVLPDIEDTQVVKQIAQRVQSVLAQPFTIGSEEIRVTSSIGIALYPEDGRDAAALLKHADTAMYHAKDQGRNNWQMYSTTLTTKAMARMNLENELRRGLEREQFVLHYQPQVDSSDGRIVGMEALIRWQHPERGLVPPSDFIPLAEESGLIVPIGEWVTRTALRQATAWEAAGLRPPRVAVNLSARQVRAPDFIATIAAILAQAGHRGEMLELELTESMLMESEIERIEGLNRLRSLGVRFAIDDFGTGYSSMSYVKRFPIGMLKIDRSFVRGLPDSTNDAAITTAIVAMAHSLDLEVIAEGVETAGQLEFLRGVRCAKVQGYLFSEPVPAAAMEALLRRPVIAPKPRAAQAA
jgi:diguanylate cyclase (GGDEF)-like protein